METTPDSKPAARVIPKFSSFKPAKPPSPPPPPEPKPDKHKDPRDGSRRHRKRSRSRECRRDKDPERRESRRDRERERDSSDRHRRPSSPPKSTSLVKLPPPRSPSPDSWDAPQKQFFTDTRGDPHNVTYGTIHRYSVPDYRRHGAGSVVGLSPEIKIDRDKGDGKGLVLSLKRDKEYVSSGKNRYAYASEGVRMLRVKKEGERDAVEFELGVDYVPIEGGRGKKRKLEEENAEEAEAEDNHYRSIEGLKKPTGKPEDKDLEYASASDSENDYVSSREWNDRKRNIELIKQVDASPQNITLWLSYVNHQDTLLSNGSRRSTLAERTSTAEVKLDILTKALDKNPGSEALLVTYMDVATTIWDPRKLLSKWQQVLKENPTITGLWTKYINFRQTDFHSFTYPECIKVFTDTLTVLRTAVFRSPQDREKIENIILYILLRLSLFMREAGYIENAIALFQCTLELNFFPPPSLPPPTTETQHTKLLNALEEFWDSEVPRIGESLAHGWGTFASTGSGTPPPTRTDTLTSSPLDPNDPFGSWFAAEEERLGVSPMPARTVDEVEEDDPYRVVLFSDLREFMYAFAAPAVQRKVVDAFLVFVGLEAGLEGEEWRTDQFLRGELAWEGLEGWFWPAVEVGDKEVVGYLEGLSMEPERRGMLGRGNPWEFGLRNFPGGVDVGVGGEGVWKGGRVEAGWVGRVVERLVEAVGEEGLAVYYLQWVWGNQKENVRKVAKILLRKFRTSLLLWNAYAQIEWHSTNPSAARNIFSTALSLSSSFPEPNRRDAIILWKTWAWEELRSSSTSQILRLLLSIESGKLIPETEYGSGNVQPALLLKARRYLEQQQDLMMSLGHAHHALAYSEVRALLEYLTHGEDILTVLSLYRSFTHELSQRQLTGTIHELTLMSQARLLYHHATTAKMFKMKILREVLEEALERFPDNTVFLGLYAWNEGRTRIEGRVRELVRDVVLREGRETVVGWGWAVWVELRMGGAGRYNVHAVRGLLEGAVGCERTKFNVGLWMMYTEFELREKNPRRAKEVLFRGIRCCPWSKDLALFAFGKLRPALDFEELRKLLSIVASEKELRVHDTTELEDMVEEMTEAQRGRLGGMRRRDFIELPDDGDDEEMRDE